MSDIERRGPEIRIQLSEFEVTLLESLVDQFTELLRADETPTVADDPFQRWQAELADEGAGLDRSDPVIQRLFPDAYPDDRAASADFRRYTQAQLRTERVELAEVVASHLADSEAGERPVTLRVIDADAWLKTLTALRLSLAMRLGIERADDLDELEALPESDPRAYVHRVYEWLGYLSERLLSLL